MPSGGPPAQVSNAHVRPRTTEILMKVPRLRSLLHRMYPVGTTKRPLRASTRRVALRDPLGSYTACSIPAANMNGRRASQTSGDGFALCRGLMSSERSPPTSAELPYAIEAYEPPYEHGWPLPPDAEELPRGALLVVDTRNSQLNARHAYAIDSIARDLSRPVFVRVSNADSMVRPGALATLSRVAARAVITEEHDLASVARQILAHPPDLGVAWVRWLVEDRELSQHVRAVIRLIANAAAEYRSVTRLLRDHGVSPRTVRSRLRRHALPPPGVCHTAGRLLRGHLWLQQDLALKVETVAWRLGYADVTGFLASSRRHFGVSPGRGRKLLGLEWRFQAWLDRFGIQRDDA